MFCKLLLKATLLGSAYKRNLDSLATLTGEMDNRALSSEHIGITEALANSNRIRQLLPDRKQMKERRQLANDIYRLLLGKLTRNMHGILPLFPQAHELNH